MAKCSKDKKNPPLMNKIRVVCKRKGRMFAYSNSFFKLSCIAVHANFDLLEHYNVKNYFLHDLNEKLAEKSVNNNKYVETWHNC
ncbi:hypothetical protein A3781_11000 [Bacillus badius]|nr:hypothetical protein A3781_11000 [Bacillus badius]